MKRFYKSVEVSGEEGFFEVLLDARPVKTPLGRGFLLPNAVLARAIAIEWRDQEADVQLAQMPLTGFAYAALDSVADNREVLVEEICTYGGSDLMCYRADEPADLVAAQQAHWDPLLNWAAERFDASLKVTTGVIHIPQNDAAISGFRSAVQGYDNFVLAALHGAVSITGSLVLALAVSEGHLSADAAWEASRVDENHQISLWGEDEEAREAAKSKRTAFQGAAQFISLVSSVR